MIFLAKLIVLFQKKKKKKWDNNPLQKPSVLRRVQFVVLNILQKHNPNTKKADFLLL